jgi:hypothetical protein
VSTLLDPRNGMAICSRCEYYLRDAYHASEGKYCGYAQLLKVDPVSGQRIWQSNRDKNHDGNCPDYREHLVRQPTVGDYVRTLRLFGYEVTVRRESK